MNKKINQAINNQVKEEFYSAYLYLAMSAYADSINLPGLANWMKIQFQEELDHAMGFNRFISERGGRVELQAINKPPKEFGKMVDIFAAALEHEQFISKEIGKLMELARAEKDFAFESFLKWYIDEQVEEEDTTATWFNKAKMAGNDKGVLFLDQQLISRVYQPGGPYQVK